jgi:L-asparaginase
MMTKRPHIAILYTGGSIAFSSNSVSSKPGKILGLEEWMVEIPEIKLIANIEHLTPYMMIPSSNMTPHDWECIADIIKKNYHLFDGFVVTHGVDALPFTASAISFMIQHTNKPIVFTSASIPPNCNDDFFKRINNYAKGRVNRNEGRINLINAVFAATSDIAEVCILYGHQLLRANRSNLSDYFSSTIYSSPSIPPLANVDFGIDIYDHCLRRISKDKVKFFPTLESKVAYFKIFPNFPSHLISDMIDQGYKGFVLEAHGLGNYPQSLIPIIGKATAQKVPIIGCANTAVGIIDYNVYRTSEDSHVDAGLITVRDMVPAAAYTKLAWVLKQTDDLHKIRKMMLTNYVDEISIATE